MKTLRRLLVEPAGSVITANDVLEFHAVRLLLLIRVCGISERARQTARIDGLTKFAKLDFFVRYPSFFEKAAHHFDVEVEPTVLTAESVMERYHYGPWDKRYYQVLPYLEARRLIEVTKRTNQYQFRLTEQGADLVDTLKKEVVFQPLVTHMQSVKSVLGGLSGNQLKLLIYELFQEEIAQKPLGAVIQP